jgi:cytidylate kinase
MGILVSGLTAAGKTTHSRLIADDLGWEYVSMATIMRSVIRDYLGEDVVEDQASEWSPQIDELRAHKREMDLEADRRMSSLVASRNRIVVDAWAQPWLCERTDFLRLWIESDDCSRSMKYVVSCERARKLPAEDPADFLWRKDEFSRQLFGEMYGIQFGADSDKFDVVFDNTEFIREPTVPDSDLGISLSHPLLRRVIADAKI